MSQTLLDQITAAVADEYTVLGQLGESPRGSAFLARERAGGHLVVLAVPPSADELSVLAALGPEVPASAGTCTNCGHVPAAWTAHCSACGRAFVEAPVGAHRYTADEVRAATEHAYDVLGEVAHESRGSLFFVRDRVDGRLVALAARTDASGEQRLEAVWDAARGQLPAPAPVVAPPYSAYDAGATQDDAFAPSGPGAGGYGGGYAGGAYAGTAGSGAYDAVPYAPGAGQSGAEPPGYPPGYVDPAAAPTDDGVRPRRRWVPFAVIGALAVAAVGGWAAMRGGSTVPPDRTLVPDSTVAGTSTQPSGGAGPGTATGAGTGPGTSVTPRESTTATATLPPPPPPPPPESLRALAERNRVADSLRRLAAQPALVQVEGELPTGWTWTINGRPGPASVSARLRPGRPASLTLEAPGYCPETLQIDAPAPGSVQRWAPRLRGKPMVGACTP